MGKRHSPGDIEDEHEGNLLPKRTRVEGQGSSAKSDDDPRVHGAIVASNLRKGRVAEYGIIDAIEMIQFMCHPRLSFKFGPQINFIIGHNGSGKSAVLTAITIGLGGKAATTGRGNGLKSFIQEGKTWAEVTITLKNEGPEAYKKDIYGDGIIITRRFTSTGTSGYKIRGKKDAKIISDKKEELSAILDHMGIQVDNPLNVLTQDAARQFLGGASSAQKYEFFLKGTQLKQLSEEYEIILANVSRLYKIIKNKEEMIPDLEKSLEDAKARYEGAKKALETRGKIRTLRHEQAWGLVKEKEEAMTKQIEEVARRSRKIPKIIESLGKAKEEYEKATAAIFTLEIQVRDLGNIDQLSAEKHKLEEHLRASVARLIEFSNDEKKISDDIKRLKNSISEFESQIEEENAKLQVDKQAEREELQSKLERVKLDIETHTEELRKTELKLQGIKDRREELTRRRTEAETTLKGHKELYDQCRELADQLVCLGRDRVAAFGQNMTELRRLIDSVEWYGEKPIGPLGLFVSLKDKAFAPVLRITLGSLMQSFAITDARDRDKLKQFLIRTQNPKTQIIVTEKDEFDYSSGEPPDNYRTVLRILEFRNEFVKRMFINHSRIERTIVATSRSEAERAVEKIHGGTAISLDLYRVTVYADGSGYSSVPLEALRPGDYRQRLFIHTDPEEEREKLLTKKNQASQDIKDAQGRVQQIRNQMDELHGQHQSLTAAAKSINDQLFAMRQTQRSLEDQQSNDISPGLASLEAGLREVKEEKENTLQQYKELATRKAAAEQEHMLYKAKHEQIKAQINAFDEKKGGLIELTSEAAAERVEAQKKIEHWESKLAEAQSSVQILENEAQGLQEEYEQWTKDAEKLCEGVRIDNPRSVAEVKRDIKSVQSALERQEREVGATIDDLEDGLRRAKYAYDNAVKDIKEMQALNKGLKQSVQHRLRRWHNFRRHIAIRTKLQFQTHLSKRGFCGKVIFNHEKQKLDLKIQTEDQAFTQGLTKEVKALSGGEKSFSTICLLLSLWEAINCPIRCLDEFDVFMDAVNRRIAMKLLIETANTAECKQFILITPQDMSNVPIGPSTRVHRMGDPERGQTTL